MAVDTVLAQAILDSLKELNGSIDYDESAVVDEELRDINKLIIPDYDADDVSISSDAEVAVKVGFSDDTILRIIYLNFLHLTHHGMTQDMAIKVAAIRAGIVVSGGYYPSGENKRLSIHCKQEEIEIQAMPTGTTIFPEKICMQPEEVPKVFEGWSQGKQDQLEGENKPIIVQGVTVKGPASLATFLDLYKALDIKIVKKMVKYLPVMGHMAFTKFGHHYVSNSYFQESYRKQFRSLQLMNAEPIWNTPDLVYNAIHWMGPYVARQWCRNLISTSKMPRPLLLKFPLSPAGAALVTSTVAVLRAAGAIPGFDAFFELYKKEWSLLVETVALIKKNPYVYHVRADLFDETSLEAKLTEAKEAAAVLAPCAQAFINKFSAGTDLARIQAIKKYAHANIGLMRRYEAIFAGNAYQTRSEARKKHLRQLIMGAARPEVTEPLIEEENE